MKKLMLFVLMNALLMLNNEAFAQIKKTFESTTFSKGDIIRVPNIEVELLNSEKDVKNDSLESLANFLISHPDLKVEIGCYTESKGNLAGNKAASQYRAQGIRDYLIKNKGIAQERLTAKGYGKSKLLVSDAMIAAAKTKEEKERLTLMNRRIELLVL